MGLDSRGQTPPEPAGGDARATNARSDDKNGWKGSRKNTHLLAL